MAKEKKMDQIGFEKIVKEFSSYAELVRAKQREKQAVMDGFDKEVRLYRRGKISRDALSAAVPRMNNEINKLDKSIKKHIANVDKTAKTLIAFSDKQAPNKFKATMLGVRSAVSRKIKSRKLKSKKKKR